jgi:peptidyl-prolyl cis-trans isomerase C
MSILHISHKVIKGLPNILGRKFMINRINKSWMAIFILFVFVLVSGCGDNEKNKKESPAPAVSTNQIQPAVSGSSVSNTAPIAMSEQAATTDIAVSVDGKILKKSELESKVKDTIKMLKDKIPADKQKEVQENVKKQLINQFVVRTLLSNEMAKRKIEVSDQEIKATTEKIKASIPPNKKLDEFLKENKISHEDIVFGIKVEKFANLEIGKKAKPTQKEISKFYNENHDKFVIPESVHVRHILVMTKKDEDEKVKAQKKEKIENLRKQLLKGDDFAEVARKNSDDNSSKAAGGDLNFIKRGQTVKAFENAAFSQEKNAIGPVITTEYGYHVIQVLERKPAKTMALEEVKDRLSAYLEQQKQLKAFEAILQKLKENAKIVVY